jgi:hypothetical protein
VTVGGKSANGPSFTTVRPGSLVPVPPVEAPPPAAPARAPSITALLDGNQQRVTTASPGSLLFLRGQGFGESEGPQSRVVFVTPAGGRLEGAVWDWTDEEISVFAPYFRGAVEVVVQAERSGTVVTSNRVPLSLK